jgi:hypothetical protein
MKKITFTRTSKIKFEELTEEEANNLFKIHRWKDLDIKKAKATSDFFRSATFLTYKQYMALVHKRPYLSEWLQFLRLSWEKMIEWLTIITVHDMVINPFKILHTYINNCNLIKTYQLVKGDYFYFDQNLTFDSGNFLYSNLYLKPDGVVICKSSGRIIFIETDMATETKKRLRMKSILYRQIITQGITSWFKEFSVIFFTTTKRRLDRLRWNNVFQELEELNLIEYAINILN